MNSLSEVEKLVASLKQSPVFNLSLSSKELFHSNFWAWLFETPGGSTVGGEEYIRVFFPNFDSSGGEVEVLREYKNMDIRIHVVDSNVDNRRSPRVMRRYVLENKIKSAPTRDQLAMYSEVLRKEDEIKRFDPFKECLLTSFFEPQFIQSYPVEYEVGGYSKEWRWLSLQRVAQDLTVLAAREVGARKAIIGDYAEMLTKLTTLLEIGCHGEDYDFITTNKCSRVGAFQAYLEEIRILDLYRKRRASSFMEYAGMQLLEAFYGGEIHVDVWSELSFNNGHSTCSFFLQESYRGEDIEIGVQIQGDQYRYYIEGEALAPIFENVSKGQRVREEDVKDAELELVELALKTGWFHAEPRDIDGYETKMQGAWCAYRPCFLYQYKTLPQPSQDGGKFETFDDLIMNLVDDLYSAKKLLTSIRLKP